MKLSVIVIVYNMQRAAPRSIQSLLSPYQQGLQPQDYEILVIENGSSEALDETAVLSLGSNVRYYYLPNAPGSPAYAINFGAARAAGEVLAIMIDGAHMLTPGVLSYGLDMFNAIDNPVVLTPQFFLGPGPQTRTIYQGYDEAAEDALLADIAWPQDGYRLFEIGVPYRIEPGGKRPQLYWFVRLFESNCLFVRRQVFDRIGGCDEQFDIPGGGILLPDLCKRLASLDDSELVQLLGEASFHQLHGGTSTNTSSEEQRRKWQSYLEQYQRIRGHAYRVSQKPIRFYGHMPNPQARALMLTG